MPSRAQQAYECIKAAIITCAVEPGQKIVQAELVDLCHQGTTPVREALQRLAQDNLVEPVPRVGYVVAPVTVADVQEIFELRYILEPAAALLATSRADQEALDEIRSKADFTYTFGDRESYTKFLSYNADFHRAIAESVCNYRLVVATSQILDELTRVFHLGLHIRDSAEEMREEHVALAEAVCDRNPDRAAEIARAQIERSHDRILQALRRHQSLPEILRNNTLADVVNEYGQ